MTLASSLADVLRRYPIAARVADREVAVRPLALGDADALLAFARALPEHDLLFLRRDITQQTEVEAWISEAAAGALVTLLACEGEAVGGYVVVDHGRLRWSRHVAELRMLIEPSLRGQGLGRLLMREALRVAMAMGIEKLVAQMTTDQRGAMVVFHNLGFENEAVLQRHVKDRDGNLYDLMVMRRWVDPEETAILLEQADA